MSEARDHASDDYAYGAAEAGAEGGKHRGTASVSEEPEAPAHGRHRRLDTNDG